MCRSALPSEICRYASKNLGAQPWTSEKIASTCSQFEHVWAPIAEKKDRSLTDAIEDKLEETGNCATVDPVTGIKVLAKSPWAKPEPGINPYTEPVYILSSAATPTKMEEPQFVDYSPDASKAEMPESPKGNVVTGSFAVGNVTKHVAETEHFRHKLVQAIAESGGVELDAVEITGRSIIGHNITLNFTITCPSYIATVNTAHNFIFNDKENYAAILEKVGPGVNLVHAYVEDTYGGSHMKPREPVEAPAGPANSEVGMYTSAASMFALSHEPLLPLSVPDQAVLGSLKLKLGMIVSVGMDKPLQKAVLRQVAAAAKVEESKLLITSVQITPKITKAGEISTSGYVEVFWTFNASHSSEGKESAAAISSYPTTDLQASINNDVLAKGGSSVKVVGFAAQSALDVGAERLIVKGKPRNKEEKELMNAQQKAMDEATKEQKEEAFEHYRNAANRFASMEGDEVSKDFMVQEQQMEEDEEKREAARKEFVSEVEVQRDVPIRRRDSLLTETWAKMMFASGAFCAALVLFAAKLRVRRQDVQQRSLVADDQWSELALVETPRLGEPRRNGEE